MVEDSSPLRGPVSSASEMPASRELTVWPDIVAPPEHENPAPGWVDPRLPDFGALRAACREHGYALGLHGSMKRDCDLIAVAWCVSSSPASVLLEALKESFALRQVGEVEIKPHGRIAYNLQEDAYAKTIDLSIIPPARAALANTPDGWREIDEAAKKQKRVDLCGYYPSTKHDPKMRRIPDCYWHKPSGCWRTAHRDRDGYSLLRSNFLITHYREIGPLPQTPETK